MRAFAWSAAILWCGVLIISRYYAIPTAFLAAAIGGTATVGVFVSGRYQAKRSIALDLHREYYSQSFSKVRRRALRFFRRYADTDWRLVNPIDLSDPDDTRDAYFEVLRFWQRVAVLYESKALDRGITEQLLSRELGQWFGIALSETTMRQGLYTRQQLISLRDAFKIGEGVGVYQEGVKEGHHMRPTSVHLKWVWNGWRWSTRGRTARERASGPVRRA